MISLISAAVISATVPHPPIQGFAHPGQLPLDTPIQNDIVDPHHQATDDRRVDMGFELHVFLGRSGNLLGHDLALLRIQLERCRDLCDTASRNSSLAIRS